MARRCGRGRWTLENDGRTRYRGVMGKGMPSRAKVDGDDLRLAADELEKARRQLLEAHAMEVVDKNGRIVKREAIRAAIGKLALATRLIDEVVLRRGGVPGDCYRVEPL